MDQRPIVSSCYEQLKEPVINISSEVDHLSDIILPSVRDSSLDDMIEEAVEESPLLTQEQREILRSLLEHYEDIFATCLDDVGTTNYKPFHIDIKPGSSMIKSKPYNPGIVMNEIVRRERRDMFMQGNSYLAIQYAPLLYFWSVFQETKVLKRSKS